MLQVASNVVQHPTLVIPANAQYILFIIQNISNFKILQETNVQVWLKENIFGNLETL